MAKTLRKKKIKGNRGELRASHAEFPITRICLALTPNTDRRQKRELEKALKIFR